jgi:hypothetical protein
MAPDNLALLTALIQVHQARISIPAGLSVDGHRSPPSFSTLCESIKRTPPVSTSPIIQQPVDWDRSVADNVAW